jgi:hypothetical protein
LTNIVVLVKYGATRDRFRRPCLNWAAGLLDYPDSQARILTMRFPLTFRSLTPTLGRGAGGLVLGALLTAALALSAACEGARMKMLTEERLTALPDDARVDVYVGKIQVPYKEVALLDSEAYSYVDDGIKKEQIEQLQRKARKLGANVIQDVHILTKKAHGYTVDERVPFISWQQGQFDLYFIRAMAVKMADSEPASLDELKPANGWAVDRYPAPPRLNRATARQAEATTHPALTVTAPPPRMPALREK